MLFVKPRYFDNFRCIASACTRSCCVGWQIAIDDKTEEKYQQYKEDGDGFIFGAVDRDAHCFLQDESGRCAMLDGEGLCEIIKRYGEGMLCDICREHPRYYNVLSDRVEGGLGLCCITAAEDILAMDLPVQYSIGKIDDITQNEGYKNIYHFALLVREWLEELLWNEASPYKVEQIIKSVSRYIDDCAFDVATGLSCAEESFISLTNTGFNSDYSPLFPVSLVDIEVLPRHKDGWGDFLFAASRTSEKEYEGDVYAGAHRRLIFYFLHRYFVTSCEDLSFASRLILALNLSRIILDVSIIRGASTLKEIATIASEFSESVEYSTENIYLILSRME